MSRASARSRTCCRPAARLAALLALLAVATPARAEPAAGWRLYRDPATGRIAAPTAGTLPTAAARSVTSAPPALDEALTPDGSAAFVDLHGQFRAAVRAERAAGGVHVHCAPATAP